jgi:hypothetical protein
MKRLILAVFALTLFCQTNLLASEEEKSYQFMMTSVMMKEKLPIAITESTSYESLLDQARELYKQEPKRIIAQGGDFKFPELIDQSTWNSIKRKMLNSSQKDSIIFVAVF